MSQYSEHELYLLEKAQVNCADFSEILGEYVEDEVGPTLMKRLESHTRKCLYCRELKEDYLLTIELAGELRERPVPKDVRVRLREGLNARLGLNINLPE